MKENANMKENKKEEKDKKKIPPSLSLFYLFIWNNW